MNPELINYFIFNGDADGICSAQQLRPNVDYSIIPITGVKRDIALLNQIRNVEDKTLYVFDIAVEKNTVQLEQLLDDNCTVYWFDHHVSKDLPQNPRFHPIIDTSPSVNTSYLVAKHLKQNSLWTIVGLFGDNIAITAHKIALEFQLSSQDKEILKEIGELFNYNAYGGSIDDLHYHPADLLEAIKPYDNPLAFYQDLPIVERLKEGKNSDEASAQSTAEIAKGVYIFPDEKWARRVIGAFANSKANENPDHAHAILVENKEKSSFVVSVRAPLNSSKSAAEFCGRFPTGGGRAKAAGINQLPQDNLDEFIDSFHQYFD